MSFFKKDMNLKLLSVILVLVIAITIFSIFYQTKIENLSAEYSITAQQLESITTKAVSDEAKVYEVIQSKETIQKDKQELEERYKTINNENQVMKNDLASLKLEFERTKTELGEKTEMFNILKNRFDQVESSLIEANNEISLLIRKINDLCDELEEIGGIYEGC